MKKILTAIVSVSIFIVGILLILCADTNFLWYAFNQNVRLTVVAGILIALDGRVDTKIERHRFFHGYHLSLIVTHFALQVNSG